MAHYHIKQWLYLSQDGTRLVERGDPEAGRVYCQPGELVNSEELAALGWSERKSVEAAPENKALEMPVKQKPKLVKKK